MTSTCSAAARLRRGLAAVAGPACLVVLASSALVAAPAAVAAPSPPAAPATPASPGPATIEQVSARVNTLRHEAEQASEAYNTARERLASTQIKVRAAAVRVEQQEAAISATRRQIGRLAVVMYRQGELSSLEVAVSDEPEALLTRAGLGTAVADRQASLVDHLEQQQERLTEDRSQVVKEQKAAAAVSAEMATNKKRIDEKVRQAQAELAQLREEQRLAMERASRERERRALAAAQSGAGSPRSTAGSTRASRSRSGGSGSGGSVSVGPGGSVRCGGRTISAPSGGAARAIAYACAQLGDPYVYGAAGPGSFDCSGLTMAAWRQGGVSLPHSSRMQASHGSRVSRASLQPGDLVFFYSPISHVGLYIGGGLMVHAPHSGDVVRIAALSSGFVGGARP